MRNINLKVAFRVDGSSKIGMGHVMRCAALASALSKIGADTLFVTKNYDAKIIKKIGEKYKVKTIPRSLDSREDLKCTMEILEKFNANIIITDSYDIDEEYLHGLKKTERFLITIDDLNQMSFPSDIVINPNLFAEKMDYKSTTGRTIFLLGVDYFLLRDEFLEARKKSRKIRKEADKLLVSMGGGNSNNSTVKVVKALEKLDNLEVIIIVGPSYKNEEKLESIIYESSNRYTILAGTPNVAKLMMECDIAITGGGLTKYELAATGTPGIIIPQVEHQFKLCRDFERAGSVINLSNPNIDAEQITLAVSKLLKDVDRRSEMSKKGRNLVDGRGIKRIIKTIKDTIGDC